MSSSLLSTTEAGSSKQNFLIIGIVVAVCVLIVIVGISIGVYFYVTREKNDLPPDVKFDTYENWSSVKSSGKPEDAGTPPTVVYGSIDLYIKDDDVTNGNWKAASSSDKKQLITNSSPGTYKNTSTTTTYSFTLNVNFTSGTVTFPADSDFDSSKENAKYLLGYTTYNDGDSPPSNGRPDYGANSAEFSIASSNIVFGSPIGFSNLAGSFQNVLLKPNQILNVSLNVLASPLTGTDEPRILKSVTFNIDSGSITKPAT